MLICEDLLCILQDKYKNISEELFPELKNDSIKKGFITLDKTDIKNAFIIYFQRLWNRNLQRFNTNFFRFIYP